MTSDYISLDQMRYCNQKPMTQEVMAARKFVEQGHMNLKQANAYLRKEYKRLLSESEEPVAMTCKTTDCVGKPIARGLCYTCYNRLRRRVQRGTAKWGDIVNAGECKPARRYDKLTTAVRRRNSFPLEGMAISNMKPMQLIKRNAEIMVEKGYMTQAQAADHIEEERQRMLSDGTT